MAAELSKKDYEMINSYLDQELSPEELLRFMDRAADPAVKAELEDFAKVRAMIRELPVETPPHQYFLTRSMAEEARPKPFWERLFPIFRTAAAFCALSLAFSFIFPLLSVTGKPDGAEPAPMESQTYVSKSLPESFVLTETEVSSSLDEQVLWFDHEDRNADQAAVMPSFGVMGGSPRNEYLLRLEAQRQPDRKKKPTVYQEIFAGGLLLSAAGILMLDHKRKKRIGHRI